MYNIVTLSYLKIPWLDGSVVWTKAGTVPPDAANDWVVISSEVIISFSCVVVPFETTVAPIVEDFILETVCWTSSVVSISVELDWTLDDCDGVTELVIDFVVVNVLVITDKVSSGCDINLEVGDTLEDVLPESAVTVRDVVLVSGKELVVTFCDVKGFDVKVDNLSAVVWGVVVTFEEVVADVNNSWSSGVSCKCIVDTWIISKLSNKIWNFPSIWFPLLSILSLIYFTDWFNMSDSDMSTQYTVNDTLILPELK